MRNLRALYRDAAEKPRPECWVAEVRVYSIFGHQRVYEAGRSRYLWVAWFRARWAAFWEDKLMPHTEGWEEIGIDWRVREGP